MRLFVLALLSLYVWQNPIPNQHDKTAHHQSPSPNSAQDIRPLRPNIICEASTVIVGNTYSASEEAYAQQPRERWFQRPSVTDWIVAGTTFAYAFMTIFILRAIKRESKIAKDAADAALKNANAVIQSERAWILCEMKRDVEDRGYMVVSNRGRTPAYIIDVKFVTTSMKTGENLPTPADYGLSTKLAHQRILAPSDTWTARDWYLHVSEELPTEVWEEVKKSISRYYVYGRIKYRDVLPDSEIHETKFCFFWSPPLYEFLIGGPSEFTSHT